MALDAPGCSGSRNSPWRLLESGPVRVLTPLAWYGESFGPLGAGRTLPLVDWRSRGRSDAVIDVADSACA